MTFFLRTGLIVLFAISSSSAFGKCEGVSAGGSHTVVDPSRPYRQICNLTTGACRRLGGVNGWLVVSTTGWEGDPVALVVDANATKVDKYACSFFLDKKEASDFSWVTPFLSGMTGGFFALMGMFLNQALSRRKDRGIAMAKWRAEILEKAKVARRDRVALDLHWPAECDGTVFDAIQRYKAQMIAVVGAAPVAADPAAYEEWAENVLGYVEQNSLRF